MPNYKNSKIYKIENTIDNEIYVGSTTQKYLTSRLCGHRYDCKQECNKKRKLAIHFAKLGASNFTIVLIEKFPCSSRDELFARERYWIITLKSSLNAKPPILENNEERRLRQLEGNRKRRQANPAHYKQLAQKYQASHKYRATKDKVSIREKEREKVKCSLCDSVLSRGSLYLHVKYQHKQPKKKVTPLTDAEKKEKERARNARVRQEKPEHYQQLCKKSRDKNRERYNAKAREKIECEKCGKTISRGSVHNHNKTCARVLS